MDSPLDNILLKRGLEKEQNFTWSVYPPTHVFKFSDEGLMEKNYTLSDWKNANNALYDFISGLGEITISRDFPKIGSHFCYVDDNGHIVLAILEKSSAHAYLLANGNCYSNATRARMSAEYHFIKLNEMLKYLY